MVRERGPSHHYYYLSSSFDDFVVLLCLREEKKNCGYIGYYVTSFKFARPLSLSISLLSRFQYFIGTVSLGELVYMRVVFFFCSVV